MKLLLDENLSRRILPFIEHAYPGSSQVALLGLERSNDRELWTFAAEQNFVIVTRDADFAVLSAELGSPPRVIWLRFGNSDKAVVIEKLLAHRRQVEEAFAEDRIRVLEIR